MSKPAKQNPSPRPRKQALRQAREQTHIVYEEHAQAWDTQRSKVFYEQKWLRRFSEYLPTGGSILELGPGGGEPLSAFLIESGFALTGLDYSKAMLKIAQRRFPQATWIFGDMRNMSFDHQFHGILGWDSFFHLTEQEQQRLLPRLSQYLLPGAPLLLTVGPQAGEVLGTVNGRSVYHASLSPKEYETTLAQIGFQSISITPKDPECGHRTILFARM